ncbi:MAG: VOC family protein [Lyngbya sp.]|nr:VOC family protein [Lyngbya sp.]
MIKMPKLGKISPFIPAGDDVEQTIRFYEQKLGFKTTYREGNPVKMAILKRDEAEIFLIQNNDRQFAESMTFRIQVEQIDKLYQEFIAKDQTVIHPNGKLKLQPWGSKDFTVLDPMGVCITFSEMTH